MDPVTNIARQRELAREIIAIVDRHWSAGEDGLPREYADQVADLANELAELVQALDNWRRSGGFDPYSATNN